MKLLLLLDTREIKLTLPDRDTPSVSVPGEKCPHCKKDLHVGGSQKRIGGHDFYESQAGCVACKAWVGLLRLYVSTLFGIEEDEAVLRGRARVY